MPDQSKTMIIAMTGLLFAAIFIFDVLTPQGLPVFVLYVLPLALTSWPRRRHALYWLAAAASSAAILAYFLTSPLAGVPHWLPILNHATGIGLFWLSAVVIQRQQDLADHLIRMAALEAENKAHSIKEQSLRRQADEIHDLYNRALCGYQSLNNTGLAIMRQVVERHSGHVRVQARSGGGSEFVMMFECRIHQEVKSFP